MVKILQFCIYPNSAYAHKELLNFYPYYLLLLMDYNLFHLYGDIKTHNVSCGKNVFVLCWQKEITLKNKSPPLQKTYYFVDDSPKTYSDHSPAHRVAHVLWILINTHTITSHSPQVDLQSTGLQWLQHNIATCMLYAMSASPFWPHKLLTKEKACTSSHIRLASFINRQNILHL